MNLTPTGFGIIVAILLVLAVIVVVVENVRAARKVLSQERLDALTDDHVQGQVDRYHCAAHGCVLVVAEFIDEGTTWRCANCRRTYWMSRADIVFDQEDGVA